MATLKLLNRKSQLNVESENLIERQPGELIFQTTEHRWLITFEDDLCFEPQLIKSQDNIRCLISNYGTNYWGDFQFTFVTDVPASMYTKFSNILSNRPIRDLMVKLEKLNNVGGIMSTCYLTCNIRGIDNICIGLINNFGMTLSIQHVIYH